MANDAKLKLIIEAINKSKGEIAKLQKDLIGIEDAGKRTSIAMGHLKTALGAAGVMGAAMAVGNFLKKSVTDWSEYAEQMEKSARLAGVSTEEMSRLTQAADDFRVTQGALESAMVMALKNGFEPSIENLADLSDEYLALKDPADRAAMASKIFGRQYAEMEPLLRQGGKAIRDGTAAIDESLIVTEESVQANKDYIKAVDDLGDAWTGVKNTVGQRVIPVLTDLLNLITTGEAATGSIAAGGNGKSVFANLIDDIKGVEDAALDATPAGEDMNEMLRGMGSDAPQASDAIQGVADATNNADAAMRSYNEALLFKIASEGLSEDASLQLAQRMGLVDEATVTATIKAGEYKDMLDNGTITLETYKALIEGIADRIAGMQDKDVTVTINTYENYHGGGKSKTGGGQTTKNEGDIMQAVGGPVTAGGNYRWQEYGYRGEKFIPSQDGYVLSRSEAAAILAKAAQGGNSGGSTINITVNGAADPYETANQISINLTAAQALRGV